MECCPWRTTVTRRHKGNGETRVEKMASRARNHPSNPRTRKTTCHSYRELLIERRRQNQETEHGQKTKSVQYLPATVLNGFDVLWRQNILCDVIIICQNRTFDAHRLLLVTCCDYFYDVFVDQLHDGREVDISHLDIDASIFQNILLCLYTERLFLSEAIIVETLQAASRLGLFLIQDTCQEFLIENTNMKNCLKMLERASKFNLSKLADKCLEIVAKYFKVISKRSRFKELPVEQIVSLLKVCEICLLVFSKFDKNYCCPCQNYIFLIIYVPNL